MSDFISGAGIIIYTEDLHSNKIKYLTLKTEQYLDFPKGGIDPGESSLDCAIRETYEESGLINNTHYHMDKSFKFNKDGYLDLYLAEMHVNDLDPYASVKITPNDHTGIVEHDDALWLTLEEIVSGNYGTLYSYLKTPLFAAEDYIISL